MRTPVCCALVNRVHATLAANLQNHLLEIWPFRLPWSFIDERYLDEHNAALALSRGA